MSGCFHIPGVRCSNCSTITLGQPSESVYIPNDIPIISRIDSLEGFIKGLAEGLSIRLRAVELQLDEIETKLLRKKSRRKKK